jgi:hypothetical protein
MHSKKKLSPLQQGDACIQRMYPTHVSNDFYLKKRGWRKKREALFLFIINKFTWISCDLQ